MRVSVNETCGTVEIGNLIVSAEVAKDIAAQIVFLCDGNLIGETRDDVVIRWNSQSEFLKRYAHRCGCRTVIPLI